MPQRRQEKMARVIKEAVSDVINNRLQDPRIEGLISITAVEIEPDMKSADVFVSVLAASETKQKIAFDAIEHAAGHIQTLIGPHIKSRFCPHLRFHTDKRFKKTLETLKIIDEVSKEFNQGKDYENQQ